MIALAASSGVARSAAPGLVSVPTSQNGSRLALLEAVSRGRAEDLRKAVGAFALDPQARRLAKLRMNVGFAARGHAVNERGSSSDKCLMVTLTYAGTNSDWSPRHLSEYLDRVRKHLKESGHAFRYVWVAELQKRGVIHYHVALWLPKGCWLPKPDKSGWWSHGMSNVIVARSAPAYLMKYLSKETSKGFKDFPKGARIYGMGGLEFSIRRARRWLNLPRFVQCRSAITDAWKRVVGGGWSDPDGVLWPSEFCLTFVGDSRACMRLHTHPQLIEASGPFSWIQ